MPGGSEKANGAIESFRRSDALRKSVFFICCFWGFTATAGLGFVVGAYIRKEAEEASHAPPVCELESGERKRIFDGLAPTWDRITWLDEITSRIWWYRRSLVRNYARGNVLEVGAGTGANVGYYKAAPVGAVNNEAPDEVPDGVTHLTLLDFSREMLSLAKNKKREDIPMKLKVGSASELKFEDNSFDSVVDTFGLCSYDDPHKSVEEMIRVAKPGGRLLFLEHGKPTWKPMQWFLNKYYHVNLKEYGCDCNKPMLEVLGVQQWLEHSEPFGSFLGRDFVFSKHVDWHESCAVEYVDRMQFGHLYYVVLRKLTDEERAANVAVHAKRQKYLAEEAEYERSLFAEEDVATKQEKHDGSCSSCCKTQQGDPEKVM